MHLKYKVKHIFRTNAKEKNYKYLVIYPKYKVKYIFKTNI